MSHARIVCISVLLAPLACGEVVVQGVKNEGSSSPSNPGDTSGSSTGSVGDGSSASESPGGSTSDSDTEAGDDSGTSVGNSGTTSVSSTGTTSSDGCTDDDGDGFFAQPDCGTEQDCNDHSDLLTTVCPPSVILLIGDGMGTEHIKAARMFESGGDGLLSFEALPEAVMMASANARGGISDSAASATAMSTGRKVDNRVIARGTPGAGNDATSALELQQEVGRRVGLVTTHTPVTDATPAAFAAHTDSRYDTAEIAADFFEQTRPNVLFGEIGSQITQEAAVAAGYTVVTTATEMLELDSTAETHVSGQFVSDTTPLLADMAVTALELVDQAPGGFFLLVEHEGVDEASHVNDLGGVIASVIELRDAFDAAVDWVGDRDDILVIVGGDHETGGLTITEDAPAAGQIPAHTWGTTGHTDKLVALFASGPGADTISGTIDNTDLFPWLAGLDWAAFEQGQAGYAAVDDTFLDQGTPTTSNGGSASIWIDLDHEGSERQGLLRFRALFGPEEGRIPSGADVDVALLELHVADGGDALQAHRMVTEWTPDHVWDDFGGDGIQADGLEALSQPEVVTAAPVALGTLTLDVTESVRRWQQAPSENHGWVFLSAGTNGVNIDSSEGTMPPRLRVYFRPTD